MPVSQSFKDRANDACFYEAYVSALLAREGLYVLQYPFKVDDNDKTDHSLTWDLDVCFENPKYDYSDCGFPNNSELAQVEVKSLNTKFTCPGDYPYPDTFVCSQSNFNKKWPGRDYTMRDFLLVSRKTGSIVWIPTMTQVKSKPVLDRSRGTTSQTMYCQKDSLRAFSEFVEMVRGK